MKTNKYKAINGIKGISTLLIILMHIAINGNYQIEGLVFNEIIKNSGIFVEMFLVISGFGMCCGYYEKIKDNKINLNDFYSRRYLKILPFLSCVVIVDVIFSGLTKQNILDGVLDLTLLYGFLPNSHIEIIGVGWTLGVIFAFYCMFPFFVFLLWNKKRAWFVLAISMFVRYGCMNYFEADGQVVVCSIATWFYHFMVGGLLFLYKDSIKKHLLKYRYVIVIIIGLLFVSEIALYKYLQSGIIPSIVIRIMFIAMLLYCICIEKSLLCTKPAQFIGEYCLELYLAHMMMFRVLEKVNLIHLFDSEIVSFIFAYVMVIVLNIIFAMIFKIVYSKIMDFLKGSKKTHGRSNA